MCWQRNSHHSKKPTTGKSEDIQGHSWSTTGSAVVNNPWSWQCGLSLPFVPKLWHSLRSQDPKCNKGSWSKVQSHRIFHRFLQFRIMSLAHVNCSIPQGPGAHRSRCCAKDNSFQLWRGEHSWNGWLQHGQLTAGIVHYFSITPKQ